MVLHNDLKCNNVLICDNLLELQTPLMSTAGNVDIQIVVVDFGRATTVANGKKYHTTLCQMKSPSIAVVILTWHQKSLRESPHKL